MPPPTRANSAIDEAPKPKPAMTFGLPKINQSAVTPMIPIPTTVRPMTAPLLKAIRSAAFSPVSAAVAVRVFPRTAMFMPMYPANAEPMAPARYASAVQGPVTERLPPLTNSSIVELLVTLKSMNTARTMNIRTTNPARMVYSLRRKAIAPSWIRAPISWTACPPAGRLITILNRNAATTSASTPAPIDRYNSVI